VAKTTKSKRPELTILVPVYNEQKTLSRILKSVTSLPIDSYEVIIVDDASTDKSPQIIETFLKNFRSEKVTIQTHRHPKNRGKGGGIQTGLKHAKGDYFVIQDADLEYNPKDITPLLRAAQENNYEVIYGSRFLGDIKTMPKANYYANKMYNILLRRLYKTEITDMHTCYKMVRTKLMKSLGMSANGFDYATELVSKLLRKGVEIHELPISFKGRTKKEGKKIDVMDGLECTYKLLRFRYGTSESLFSEKSTTTGRFLLVGGVGFVVNYVILVALTQFNSVQHVLAEAIAAVVALQVTFVLHDRWTYQLHTPPGTARLSLKARYPTYITTNAMGSIMTIVLFGILYNYLSRLPSLLLAAMLGIVWNYVLNTYVIWRPKSN